MKKNTLMCMAILFAIALYPITANAQNQKKNFKVGVDLGLSQSILKNDVSNLADVKYEVGNGISTGVDVEYNFFSDFVVSSGISFVQRNYRYKKTDAVTHMSTKYRNNFLNIPLNVGVYILKNPHKEKGFWLKVQGGIFYEYLTSVHRKGTYPIFSSLQPNGDYDISHVDEKYDFGKNENHYRRSFWGLEGMGFVGYSFETIDVFASYSYQFGLSDVYKVKTSASDDKTRRNSHVISLGVAYKF